MRISNINRHEKWSNNQKLKGGRIRMKSVTIAMGAMLILLALIVLETSAQTPSDFTLIVFAGSYAPWGTNQSLVIDSLWNVSFYQSELPSGDVDSVFAVLDSFEMQAINDTVMTVNFFNLDTLYDSGAVDGSGIFLRIMASEMEHSVQAINITVPEVDRIVRTLNTILEPYGIKLNYGTLGN